MRFGHVQDTFPFVHRRIEDFQYLDIIRRHEQTLTYHPLGELFNHDFPNSSNFGGRGHNADTNRMLVRVMRQLGKSLHFCRCNLHPLARCLIELDIGRRQIIDAGSGRILQCKGCMPERFEKLTHFPGELWLHAHAVQRLAVAGVDHHRAADEHGGVIMLHRVEHHLAFGEVSPRGKTDQKPGRQRLVHRRLGSRRNRAVGSQQRAVQVDCDHAIGHRYRAPRQEFTVRLLENESNL